MDQRKAIGFCRNLKQRKILTIEWAKRKKDRDDHTLADIEVQLASLIDESGQGYISIEEKLHLVDLEAQRSKILLDQEETWRLRSREIWLQVGDGNTKFFHKYANGRKANNTIWEMPSDLDRIATTHPQLTHLGISHFKQLFKAQQGTSIAEIISIVGHFLSLVELEGMEDLIKPVSMGN